MASNIIVNFAPCFYYNDPANGDIVKQGLIEDYVKRIAIQVCDLIQTINTQKALNLNFNNRITTLEKKVVPVYTLPNLYPVCIGPQTTLLPLDQFTKLLEQKFCELSTAAGSSTEIFNAITTPPSDFNHAKALGTSGGTLGELAGWVLDPKNLTDSFVNMWLTIGDLRSAVRNIQLTCCNTSCSGIELVMIGTLENKILKLFFNGTIPANLSSCIPGGSTFIISDNSGNSFSIIVDIQGNMNNISGVSIDLNSTSLNFADDLSVKATTCFSDFAVGSVCQNCLEIVVNNNLNCPSVAITVNVTSIAFSFVHNSGTLTYSIQLFDSNNNMVQSENISVISTTTVSGTFSSLSPNSNYKLRVQMITASNTKTCPFTVFTTLPNPCAAPNGVNVTLSINGTPVQPTIDLGSASGFGALGGSTITTVGTTTLNSGILGLAPGTSVTGPFTYNGGAAEINTAAAIAAKASLVAAYSAAATASPAVDLSGLDLGGMTLIPGVYKYTSSALLTGALTLSGAGTYVIQIASTLTTDGGVDVILTNGATADKVFFQVGSSATLGANTVFNGRILASASITVNGGTINGALMANTGAITFSGSAATIINYM